MGLHAPRTIQRLLDQSRLEFLGDSARKTNRKISELNTFHMPSNYSSVPDRRVGRNKCTGGKSDC